MDGYLLRFADVNDDYHVLVMKIVLISENSCNIIFMCCAQEQQIKIYKNVLKFGNLVMEPLWPLTMMPFCWEWLDQSLPFILQLNFNILVSCRLI